MKARWTVSGLLVLVGALASTSGAGEAPKDKLVPLKIVLPPFIPTGTQPDPKTFKLPPNTEAPSNKPRPAFLAPEGVTNVALKKPVTSSDDSPIVGEVAMVADGDRDGSDGHYVELGPGRQWVQIDLQQPAKIYAIVVWHFFSQWRAYHDVAIQVADDADFITNVRTLFSNDFDNSSGLGIGKDLEYFESNAGRLIDAKGELARYVRLYSKGSTASDLNHYIEVEVYGKPAK